MAEFREIPAPSKCTVWDVRYTYGSKNRKRNPYFDISEGVNAFMKVFIKSEGVCMITKVVPHFAESKVNLIFHHSVKL